MIYKFRDGARVGGDAQAVGEELEAIRTGGVPLTPNSVLARARSGSSVLHEYFEWDDHKAAEAHRLDQAGHLIRAVVVVIEPEPTEPQQVSLANVEAAPARIPQVRAFVPVQTTAGDRVYVSTTEALASADYRQQVLRQAHQELDAVARKYRELREVAGIISAVDEFGALVQSWNAAVTR